MLTNFECWHQMSSSILLEIPSLVFGLKQKKKRVVDSRILGTRLLAKTAVESPNPPSLFISASGLNNYGYDTHDRVADESSSALGPLGFLGGVGQAWEDETNILGQKNIRTILLRTPSVLDPRGGTLQAQLGMFKWGFGGIVGSGKQYVPWLTMDDYARIISFVINNKSISGPINIGNGKDTTNAQYTAALGKAVHRPTWFWIPQFLLHILPSSMSEFMRETLFANIRAIPKKLMDHGFVFKDVDIESTMRRLVQRT
eukprot:TRINITY_DN9264_c0_g1_i4.p1 TRINITY_DN9264_c0_g1~~TRINITY_DN9264_c0_g1_i4.p1  ORF type:complete len:257 (+),score=69.16 TRINITY_DN9264_c0_g1_i4:151-921(+)